MIVRLLPLLLLLAGCSNSWTAALQLERAPGAARQPLTVKLRSTLGDEFSGVLTGDCLEARIRQSPKLKNQISITVYDASGKLLGAGTTHDLANRPFEIALDDAGALAIRPGVRCR